MTDTDREYISDGERVDSHKRYQAISRVRNRINEELSTDVRILREHHPDLLEELREVVCEESVGDVVDTRTPGDRVEEDGREKTEEPRREEPVVESAQTLREEAREMLEGKGLAEPQKDAVLAAWDHLRERGTSQRSVFIEDVYPEHDAGYANRGLKSPERAWWKNVIDEYLPDLPGVEKPTKEGGHQWTFTGDSA